MKLFISLRKTVDGVAEGAITAEDLRTGLFYFSCSQNVVLRPHWASSWEPEASIEARPGQPRAEAHAAVVEAALDAEADDRLTWWIPGKPMSFESVNAMFRRVGIGTIPGYDGRPLHPFCDGPGIKARVDERQIPIDIIF
ncbi:MAG TPA: hypothetical protein VL500_00295 [Candidatus Eisenbacteria bacterium]|jgi:hypothetical protein|nr:hypothetical protein [Candidatus Eisenbacteria bacterium]